MPKKKRVLSASEPEEAINPSPKRSKIKQDERDKENDELRETIMALRDDVKGLQDKARQYEDSFKASNEIVLRRREEEKHALAQQEQQRLEAIEARRQFQLQRGYPPTWCPPLGFYTWMGPLPPAAAMHRFSLKYDIVCSWPVEAHPLGPCELCRRCAPCSDRSC